jgi:hypothetical protein
VPGKSDTKARLSWLAITPLVPPLAEANEIGLETVRPCGSGGAFVSGLVIESSRQPMIAATAAATTIEAILLIGSDMIIVPTVGPQL